MPERGLEIRVLGELEIFRARRVVSLPASKKTRALLGYLAATGRSELRARLVELLWDGPDDPRAALRWSLNRIRPLLNVAGAERLKADREHVALDLNGVTFDLAILRHHVRVGPLASISTESLRRSAELFRGDFLEGLELPDCPRYYEWCQAERSELRRLRLALLEALVQRVDDPDARVRYARTRIAIDPYDERAHADLVLLLSSLGRADEAVDQYNQCRRLLERDLGVSTSSVLEAARAQVGPTMKSRAALARATSVTAGALPAAGAIPLVGREAELSWLDALADAVKQRGTPKTVLVIGDAGIGKSRLLDELAQRTATLGGYAIASRAFEVEVVRPYGLWIDALRSVEVPGWPSELSPTSPAAARVVERTGRVDRALLLDAARGAITALAKRSGLLTILLDDIQWIDEASAALVHLVSRAEGPILIVCAARLGEIYDNPAALRLIRTLRRQGKLERIELSALEPNGTAQLVRAAAPTADAARVHAESGGNPLFAIEIARSLSRGEVNLPESLRALVSDRIDQLEVRARELLLYASAFGKSFRAELLGEAAGVRDPGLSNTLEDLQRRRFLAPGPRSSEYDFVHDVIRRSAYLCSSELRRRALHKRIARALADASTSDDELLSDLAYHAALGGEAELAARGALAAAERCQRLFANAEALAIAERGLSYTATLPRDKAIRFEVGFYRVAVCSGGGTRRRAELESALLRIASEAQQLGASSQAADALYVLSILHHEGGNFPGAEASVRRAVVAGREADARTKARSLAHAGRCLAQIERDVGQASALLLEAETVARSANVELSEIPWGLGLVRHFTGDHERAVTLLEQALQRVGHDRDHWACCDCLIRLVMVALETGRFEAASQRCRELASVAVKMGEGSEGSAAAALAALAQFALADATEATARQAVTTAIDALRQLDAKGLLAYALTLAAELELRHGRADAALAYCEEAVPAAGTVGRRSLIALAQALMARALYRRGDLAAAAAHLKKGCLDFEVPWALSARARAALGETAKIMGVSFSTFIPTRVQTVDG